DGALILDKWFDQGGSSYHTADSRTAGTHRCRVGYVKDSGGAVAQVSWATGGGATGRAPAPSPSPVTCGSVGSGVFVGCYYDNTDFTNLKLARTEPAINFVWGLRSPDPTTDVDTLSLHYARPFYFS